MEKLDFTDMAANGNAAFSQADRAAALYVQLVEKLYALGEDVAARIESPERIADALIKAAESHIRTRQAYRLAEKALVTACRILYTVCPNDKLKLAKAYKLLGHVCCRQGKHCQAVKYNTLAAMLLVSSQRSSERDQKGR